MAGDDGIRSFTPLAGTAAGARWRLTAVRIAVGPALAATTHALGETYGIVREGLAAEAGGSGCRVRDLVI